MSLMKSIGAMALSGAYFAALAAGCIVSSDEDDPVQNPLTTETGFCDAVARGLCNDSVVDACYGSDASTLEADRAACVTAAANKACNPDGLHYRPGVEFVAANACIAAMTAAYTDAKLTMEDLDSIEEDCHAALSGTGKKGSTCMATSECDGEAGLECVAKPGVEGMCEIPSEIGAGRNCSSSDAVCEDEGFFCIDLRCVEGLSSGSACSATQPCTDAALCTVVDEMEPEVMQCVAKAANGATCDAPEKCTGGFCEIATGAAEGSCRASINLSTTNGTCGDFL